MLWYSNLCRKILTSFHDEFYWVVERQFRWSTRDLLMLYRMSENCSVFSNHQNSKLFECSSQSFLRSVFKYSSCFISLFTCDFQWLLEFHNLSPCSYYCCSISSHWCSSGWTWQSIPSYSSVPRDVLQDRTTHLYNVILTHPPGLNFDNY